MRYMDIGGEIRGSEVAFGCMRLAKLDRLDAEKLIDAAVASGINYFDNADIYGQGRSEEVFAQALCGKPSVRANIIIQSKCGICDGFYDSSKEHILEAVDGSLKRLKTDYLDVLLLHRPDALIEPEEVAGAFDALQSSGKVRHFGVSNYNPAQIELLGRYLRQPLIINQLQLSIMHTGMLDSGMNVNMTNPASADRDGGVLDYCRLKDMTVQAWSPFQYGFLEGVFLGNAKFPELNKKIDEIAAKYGVTNSAVAVAWISRHPAGIQTVVGTTNAGRLGDICRESEISLTRREWYEIYTAAGNRLP